MWVHTGRECVEFVGEDEKVTKVLNEERLGNVEYNCANTQWN
jgi:hypothetical protein